jgi:peptide/nickel transport system permease protein
VLRSAPWLSILPGCAVMVTVLGVYLTGEGLAESLARRRGQSG